MTKQNDRITITIPLAALTTIAKKETRIIYLPVHLRLIPGMQISKILSHVASLRRRTFFPFLSCQEKVPVYYLNNGSRACVIVSPLFLFRRLTLLVTAERRNEKGRGLFCFESRKKTERADGRRGGKEAKFRAG